MSEIKKPSDVARKWAKKALDVGYSFGADAHTFGYSEDEFLINKAQGIKDIAALIDQAIQDSKNAVS